MSVLSNILEGLSKNRVNESFSDVYIMTKDEFKLSDDCTSRLEKKYLGNLKPFGVEFIQVDITSSDDDDNHLEDVVNSVSIGLQFYDGTKVDAKKMSKDIDKVLKNYPKFDKYDARTNQIYFEVTDLDDISDALDALKRDGCPIDKYCQSMSSDEVERHKESIEREWEEDRRYQEREWYRSRM